MRRVLLLLTSGIARLDNRNPTSGSACAHDYCRRGKAVALTGHPLGGIEPFGRTTLIPTYCDQGLRAFYVVYTLGGSRTRVVELAPHLLTTLVGVAGSTFAARAA